jgi:exosortase/archaeosortase family protein
VRGLGADRPAGGETGLPFKWLLCVIDEERLRIVVPLFGFLLLISWSIWKIYVTDSTNLRMQDIIVTLMSLSFILYYSGSVRYQLQKDFVVLYLIFLTFVFVVIWNLYEVVSGESYSRANAYSEFYFVTTPVTVILNLIGVEASAQLDLSGHGLSNLIQFEYGDRSILLGIGSGCSGLYSAGLFFSAFLAFVLVRYRKVDRYILAGLAVGLALTWVANIFRMVVTVLVGSVYGPPALVAFHMYFGILLFIAVISVFWFLIVRWLDKHEVDRSSFLAGERGETESSPMETSRESEAIPSGDAEKG